MQNRLRRERRLTIESREMNTRKKSMSKDVTASQQTLPDNVVTKFAYITKRGFHPRNPDKVNQDSYLTHPHVGGYRRTHLFAVCDGHGMFGKPVSTYIKERLRE